MIENIRTESDTEVFKSKVNTAINGMLECLLSSGIKKCRNCSQVDSCRFLAEAVFAYRYRDHVASLPAV
ncbi:MAG: hypothetical protein C4538_10090 [Nitrospiraceae bacterium]|nr:MAG: hypothetical protein C4538_10090 [Nitrospiraceae bacterium]